MNKGFDDLHYSKHLNIERYRCPETLEEALAMLGEGGVRTKVIAGGTDVIPRMRTRDLKVDCLVDISRVPGLDSISQDGSLIHLGGLVTHSRAAASELVREKARPLAEGAQSMGSPQIRNIATIGGNVVSGQPAADTVIPLLALDAEISVVSHAGERTVPLHDFFTGVGTTVLDSTKEILTKIRFSALGENEAGCYLRIGKRRALTLPVLVCAVVVRLGPDRKRFAEVRIALGPVAPVPYRAAAAEFLLKGASLEEGVLVAAAEKASQDARPRDSRLRGSASYRVEMVKVLVKRGLANCLRQLGV